MELESSHDDFEDFVEFIGWEDFDALDSGLEARKRLDGGNSKVHNLWLFSTKFWTV